MKYVFILFMLSGCIPDTRGQPFDYKATGYSVNNVSHRYGNTFAPDVYLDDEFYYDCIEYQMEFCYE